VRRSLVTEAPGSGARRLLAFYRGEGTDHRGRRLADIQAFGWDELERSHDYVQWMFPLFERSRFQPHAPVLDETTAQRFRDDPRARQELRASLTTMLEFYGLTLSRGEDELRPRVVRGPDFERRSAVWLTPMNHNFLRLTRILCSLCVLGEAEHARALLTCLEEIAGEYGDIIGAETLAHWRSAVVA
jgi:hypothetical protein